MTRYEPPIGASARSHFVAVNGLTLHVVEYGGDGPPLLAVHGTGLVAQVWGVMVPYLTPYFRVFALDRRGHGDSDKAADSYDIASNVADIVGVAEYFGMQGAAGLGHSSGGTVLGLVAARHPGVFRRVAMVDPIVFARLSPGSDMSMDGSNPMVELTLKRRAVWPSARAMFESLGSKPPFDTWRPEVLWDYVSCGAAEQADGSVTLKCPPELEAEMYRGARTVDLFEEFARIAIPVLVIRAEHTDRFPRENAERAVRLMRQGRLLDMPGVTHFAPMEDPERVARLCVEFLTDAADSAPATG